MDPLAYVSLAVLTLVLAVLIGLRAWRHRRTVTPVLDALIAASTTCLGVFLALSVNTWHEARATRARVCMVVKAARAEAVASLAAISKPVSADPLLFDPARLLLEHPTRVLSALMDMPAFLESGSADAVVELAQLRTALDWSVTYRNDPAGGVSWPGGPKKVTADPQVVRPYLARVDDRLGAEEKRLCGQ